MMVEMEAGPAAVGLSDAKAYLRLEHGGEDGLIAGLLRSAGEACEAFTGLVLTERAVREIVPAGAAWARLTARPVRAIESVAALGLDGAEAPLPPDAYAVDIDAAGDGWVRVTAAGQAKRVRVAYRAGLAAEENEVPEPLRQGIVRLAAHLYGARDQDAAPPAAVTALWRPWRRMRLG
jgi:uncharacterized phiE125 gp8 family phage protein